MVLKLKNDESPAAAPVPQKESPWHPMDSAPKNRAIFLTHDPHVEDADVLCYWRRSRIKVSGVRGWQPHEYWALSMTNREIEFKPVAWREAAAEAALQGLLEQERFRLEQHEAMLAKQAAIAQETGGDNE